MATHTSSTFPLGAGIAVPLVFIIPTGVLLYIFVTQFRHNTASPSTERTSRVEKQNAPTSRISLASLDVRPFLDRMRHRSPDAGTNNQDAPAAESETPRPVKQSDALQSSLFSYTLGTFLSLLCGLVYLSCASSTTSSAAINLPLGISVTLIPFLILPHAITGLLKKFRKSSAVTDERWRSYCKVGAPIFASFLVGILGAWASPYIFIAILSLVLVSVSGMALSATRFWDMFFARSRLQLNGTSNRRTKSWFSGNALSRADADALARQGNIPRPGESEEAFLTRMQQEGNSWITETGNATLSRTRLMSSFSYADSYASRSGSPATPTIPQTAFIRPISSSSSRTTNSSSERKGKNRTYSSNTNSWITEPTESGTTMSSFRFDSSRDIPPVPVLTASTKARYGVPSANPQTTAVPRSFPTAEESTFYGEGPSILRIGDPANMTFASYDSLPIKHGKRSTNFEILGPADVLSRFPRSSKSPSAISFRKRSKRTASEESFHSAIDDPCQITDKTGSTRNPDQSFPRSVSVSSDDQRDMFCDAFGSGRDDASLDVDAIETVVDEDEFDSRRSKSFEARRSAVQALDITLPSNPSLLPPIAERFMRSNPPNKPSTSESEIFLPVSLDMPGRDNTQSYLPERRNEDPSRYSLHSSVASPMSGGFGRSADKKSTDPLLMGGKASSGMDTINWRSEDVQVSQQRGGSGGRAEEGRIFLPSENSSQERLLQWTLMGNLLVLWTAFGLALPLLVDHTQPKAFALALYLVSVVLPALSIFVTCFVLGTDVTAKTSRIPTRRTCRLRPLTLQSRHPANLPVAEKSTAHINAFGSSRRFFAEWRNPLDRRSKNTNMRFMRQRVSEKPNHSPEDGSTSFEAIQYGKRMARRSSEIWLQNGNARPSSGRFDRMISLVAPHPRVSMIQPTDQYEMSDIQEADPDETPRPRRIAVDPIRTSHAPFELDNDRFSAYSILDDGGRASPGEYPCSPNRTDYTLSRPDSMTSSPEAKSVKLASVHQAVRGRMSLGPTFLIGGSQGDAIITARRSMDLDTALRIELSQHESMHEEKQSTKRAEVFDLSPYAIRASEDQSQFQESYRRSGDILGGPTRDDVREERRRTFDFGKMWSGWKKASEKEGGDRLGDFEDIDPERLNIIMMADMGNAAKPARPSSGMDMAPTRCRRTPGGETSASTIRESKDLPAFRPSEDFILPGQRGDEPSVDFGRPSIAPEDRTSFSIECQGDISFMTPRYSRRRNSSQGADSGLPEMTGVDFLADFKGAIREMGRKAEDTPAREAVRSILAGLATPHAVQKKGSSTSARGILKHRPSTEAKSAISAPFNMGHNLPPIPADITRGITYKSSAFSIGSAGRSTPVPCMEEEPTSASQTSLFLPPPRNQQRNGGKSSAGPLSIVLQPLIESDESCATRVVVREPSPNLDSATPVSLAPPASQHLTLVTGDYANPHERSASTNTAIEEIETIMAMDSPTTASYLQTNFLSRPQSVITGYDGPVSAPAHAPVHSFAAAQQSTQQVDDHHLLKSSRSTPAFAVASSWTSSRPTVGAAQDKENLRPGSTYSYLGKDRKLPPLPLQKGAAIARRGSLPPQDLPDTRRLRLGEVTSNVTEPALTTDERMSGNPKVQPFGNRKMSDDAERLAKAKVAKKRQSPRKTNPKPKPRGSTRVGGGDASVKVMRF